MEYDEFIKNKRQLAVPSGFEPGELNPNLFDWQESVTRWALNRGRAALFCGCGLGKTIMQLAWAAEVAKHTNSPVVLHSPVGVRQQTVREAEKFGIDVPVVACDDDGDIPNGAFIAVTNYEKLHRLNTERFAGVVLDESSILKSFTGKTKQRLTESYSSTPYRLACTATPAPNDNMELGNHSQFLGVMPSTEMLSRWFLNDTMKAGGYRLKGHAAKDFWRWMATWSVCMSKPSDLDVNYDDSAYELPPLNRFDHVVELKETVTDGHLFGVTVLNATTLHSAKRESCNQRASKVASLISGNPEPWIVWCDTNYEADELYRQISQICESVVEVRGSDDEKTKEEKLAAFSLGKSRVIVTKPDIAGFGMNWQHCRNVAFVGLSYSYEKFYQAVRRSYRFGQTKEVNVHVVSSEMETAIDETVERKAADHARMQEAMIESMREAHAGMRANDLNVEKYLPTVDIDIPEWLISKN